MGTEARPRRRLALVALCALLAGVLALGGCGDRGFSWHQKLTVTVETPDGIRTGSAVQFVRWEEANAFFKDAAQARSTIRGEAVAVDLGEGRYMFALLGHARSVALGTYAPEAMPKQSPHSVAALLYPARLVTESDGAQRPVPPQYYPLLVTFKDMDDPASVKRVDPNDLDAVLDCPATDAADYPWRAAGQTYAQWADDETNRLAIEGAATRAGFDGPIAAALTEHGRIRFLDDSVSAAEGERLRELEKIYTHGQARAWRAAYLELKDELPATLQPPPSAGTSDAGQAKPCYRLQSITLEITDEPVTDGQVEAALGWLRDVWPNRLDGKRFGTIRTQNRFANSLSANSFSTEISR